MRKISYTLICLFLGSFVMVHKTNCSSGNESSLLPAIGSDGTIYVGASSTKGSLEHPLQTTFPRQGKVYVLANGNNPYKVNTKGETDEYDPGIVSIDSPPDTIFVDSIYIPKASFKNYGWGGSIPYGIQATCDIRMGGFKVYHNNSGTFNIPGSGTKQVSFASWLVGKISDSADILIYCFSDSNPDYSNDTLSKSCVVDTITYAAEEKNNTIGEYSLQVINDKILMTIPHPLRNAELCVYNVAGELVNTLYKGKLEGKTYVFHNGIKTKGVYFVILKWDSRIKTAKFIKLR